MKTLLRLLSIMTVITLMAFAETSAMQHKEKSITKIFNLCGLNSPKLAS